MTTETPFDRAIKLSQINFGGEIYTLGAKSPAMQRALALATMDLSRPLANHVVKGSGRSTFYVPIGTKFGEWTTVGEPYIKKTQGGRQSHTSVDVRCSCGIVFTRILSSVRLGKSVRCQSCQRGKS